MGQLDDVRKNIETRMDEIRSVADTGAMKGVKLERFDLLAAEPMRMFAELMGKGALKYAERNWEKGYDWSKSFAAMQRHAWAFWSGENIDACASYCPENCQQHMNLPHTVCIMFHAMVLTEFMETRPELDDRPKED